MIERVARAICEAEKMNPDDALGGWVHWQDAARAAIEAMRDTNREVQLAANSVGIERGDDVFYVTRYEAEHIWQTMIDAALSPIC